MFEEMLIKLKDRSKIELRTQQYHIRMDGHGHTEWLPDLIIFLMKYNIYSWLNNIGAFDYEILNFIK